MTDDQEVKEKLRKPLILLCFLIVAIFSIYVIYYYAKRSSFTSTILADADTTEHLAIIPYPNGQVNFHQTVIYSAAFPIAISAYAETLGVTDSELLPAWYNSSQIDPADYVIAADSKPAALQDSVNDRILGKFENHPPVEIKGSNNGFTVFSYLLKRVHLPQNFQRTQLLFEGSRIEAILYQPNQNTTAPPVKLYRQASNSVAIIPFGEDEDVWLIKAPGNATLLQIFLRADSLTEVSSAIVAAQNATLTFPLLDFAVSATSASAGVDQVKMTKEMVKMSLSPGRGRPADTEQVQENNPWSFNQPYLLCLKKRSALLPYFMIWVGNDELLHRARH